MKINHLAVYGSLRKSLQGHRLISNPAYFEYLGDSKIAGTLFALDWYPGVILGGDGEVVVEVYKVLDQTALEAIDFYEGYDEYNPEQSLFIPRSVQLTGDNPHNLDEVHCYEYNRYTGEAPTVESGDWKAHVSVRNPA